MGFFMELLIGVKIPPKSHGILIIFKTSITGVYTVNVIWAENQTIFWEEFSSIFYNVVGESPDFLSRPELNVALRPETYSYVKSHVHELQNL
jgi:hypothetical protein